MKERSGILSNIGRMPRARSDDGPRRRLLNIMLSALGAAALLMLMLGLALRRSGAIAQSQEWRSFLAATVGLLLAATAIWLVNRYGSRPLAALLFLLLLIGLGL